MFVSSEYMPENQNLTSLDEYPEIINSEPVDGVPIRRRIVTGKILLDTFGAAIWQTSNQTSTYRWKGEDSLTWGYPDKWILAEWARMVLDGLVDLDLLEQYKTLQEIVIKTKILNLEISYENSKSDDVRLFLYEYPKIIDVLQDGSFYLVKHFGSDAQFTLDIVCDHESTWTERQLFVNIRTTMEVEEALERLDCFDNEWFLKQFSRVGDFLNFNIELL